MSTESQEFEKLQVLLKLKRYEQPPPGYFSRFSVNVINRIEAEERNSTPQSAWLKKFMFLLQTNPIAAGLFGVSVCGMLISGIIYSQGQAPAAFASGTGSDVHIDIADSGSVVTAPEWTKTALSDSMTPSATPVLTSGLPGATLFSLDNLKAQPVNFTVTH